jgi:hypothetical protein
MAESGSAENAIVPFVPLFFTDLGELSSVQPQNHSFVKQVEGYVKALEKSTFLVLRWGEVFEHYPQND